MRTFTPPLTPSHCVVNRQKSDAIPAPELLLTQRDRIIDTWHLLHGAEPELFEREIRWVIGEQGKNWEKPLFGYFRSQCEAGVHTRGLTQWSPTD